MNNYSWLQQRLHQIALSSQFMREVTFDAESSSASCTQNNDNHVFVVGLARSGTTVLLNALFESREFASLSYQDMPFVLAPNLWSKLSFANKDIELVERAHGDGIKISLESPEAFEEVFWMTFNENNEDTKEKFKTYTQLIKQRYQKERYLSKNNQNIKRLELISSAFPHSKILIPFRDPAQHANSLLAQHQKFIEDSKKDKFIYSYMKWIGHTEFGPNYIPIHNKNLSFKNGCDVNHWLEQWYLTYLNCYETFEDKDNVHFICYEKLCSSKEYWLGILKMLGIKKTYDFTFQESQKEITLDLDSNISSMANSLYFELIK
jgi:hypothetical protein